MCREVNRCVSQGDTFAGVRRYRRCGVSSRGCFLLAQVVRWTDDGDCGTVAT